MGLSFQQEVSDGVRSTYTVSFPFLSQDYIFVYAGEDTEYTNQLSYQWVSSNTIELTNLLQVPAGTEFKIRRVVPRDKLIHTFADKSIRGVLVDRENTHALHLIQEFLDGFINLEGLLTYDQNIDMAGNRIVNLGTPLENMDAANKAYVDNYFNMVSEVVLDSVIPYEVPEVVDNKFKLPVRAKHAQVEVDGRILGPSDYSVGMDKQTVTLNVVVDAETKVVTRFTLASGLDSAASSLFLTPYSYGAVGNGDADDTAAIQNWLDGRGTKLGAPGVFLISEQLNAGSNTVVQGSGSGSGTVGEQDIKVQVNRGACILKAAAEFTGEALIKFKDDKSSALYSCNVSRLKFDMTGSDVHAMVFEKAYDNLRVDDVNVMNLGDNSSALIIRGNKDIPSNAISQTILLMNIMGIHENGTATAPTMYFEACQEMTLVGVKAFGGFQVDLPLCYPMHFRDCRGVNLVGCSQAHTEKAGILVDSVTRSSDGISIHGNTFENCLEGGLKVRGAAAPNNVARVYITNPRYQFPQGIAFDIDGADGCIIDAAARTGVLGSQTNQNEIKTLIQSNIVDNGNRNTIVSPPSGVSAERTVSTNFGSEGYLVGKQLYARSNSSPLLQFIVGSLTYTTKFGASKTGQVETLGNVSYTFSSGAIMEHQSNGNLRLAGTPSNRRTSLILDDANGVPWAFRFDTGGVPAIVNQNDSTVVGFTGVLPLANGQSATVIRGVITQVV